MKFTTPCFVRVEDVEKRDALIDWCASIGYDTNKWKISPKVRYVFCRADFAGRSGEKALESLPHNSIDCGTDIDLFKALAAMNDENDQEQWFIAECDINDHGTILWHEGELGLYDEIVVALRDLFGKATAEEILTNFKSK